MLIETPRLRLRPLAPDDSEAVHRVVLGDPAVTWDGRARTPEESRRTALGLRRVVAVVRPGNLASQRVLAKAGLRFERAAVHYGAEVQLWAAALPPAAPDPAAPDPGATDPGAPRG